MANNKYEDKKGRYEVPLINIDTIDQAVTDYFDKKLDVSIDASNTRKKVPIVFATGERWKMVRERKGIRNDKGILILPLITLQRMDIEKSPGPGFSGLPTQVPSLTVTSSVHRKSGNLQNQLKQRAAINYPEIRKELAVREYLTIPFPTFCTVYYQLLIWTQHMEDMNDVLQQIFDRPEFHNMDSFQIPVEYERSNPKGNGYYFIGFRDGNISTQSNFEEFTDQERIIRYVYNFKVSAYLITDSKNKPLSYGTDEGKNVVYKEQNIVEVKFQSDEDSYSLTSEEFKRLFG